jgi:heme-degrading monooxygenase HmoA
MEECGRFAAAATDISGVEGFEEVDDAKDEEGDSAAHGD